MREPEDFIVQFADRIPTRSEVVDIACGRGRHSLFFARRGSKVIAMDESVDCLAELKRIAVRECLDLTPVQADVEHMSLLPESCDVIVNTLFLWRPLFDQYTRALRPGGILYFRTFTTDQADILGQAHPSREFQLEPGELRQAFRELQFLHYEESLNDKRALATVVAQRQAVTK